MNIKNLFATGDDRAVSPVIGVILMVAITVVLAAVIGTFVLGLGDQVQETSPNAQWSADQGTTVVDNQGASEGTDEFTSYTITHEGGQAVEADNIDVTVDGALALGNAGGGGASNADSAGALWDSGTEISAGSSITIVAAADYDAAGNLGDYSGTSSQLDVDTTGDGSADSTDVGLNSGQTVRIIWGSDSSDQTATLFERGIN